MYKQAMQQISLRDFQRNFSKVSDTPVQVTKNNQVIGVWMPVGRTLETPPQNPVIETEQLSCSKCKKTASYQGTVWEDGEELKVNLCSFHYQGMPSKKSFKQL